MSPVKWNEAHLLIATLCILLVVLLQHQNGGLVEAVAANTVAVPAAAAATSPNSTAASVTTTTTANPDECEKCGPTRLIGCRGGRCYYKCIRRCLGKDSKFYYEALKFNLAGL